MHTERCFHDILNRILKKNQSLIDSPLMREYLKEKKNRRSSQNLCVENILPLERKRAGGGGTITVESPIGNCCFLFAVFDWDERGKWKCSPSRTGPAGFLPVLPSFSPKYFLCLRRRFRFFLPPPFQPWTCPASNWEKNNTTPSASWLLLHCVVTFDHFTSCCFSKHILNHLFNTMLMKGLH